MQTCAKFACADTLNSTSVHAFFQGNLPCNVIVFNKALNVVSGTFF